MIIKPGIYIKEIDMTKFIPKFIPQNFVSDMDYHNFLNVTTNGDYTIDINENKIFIKVPNKFVDYVKEKLYNYSPSYLYIDVKSNYEELPEELFVIE